MTRITFLPIAALLIRTLAAQTAAADPPSCASFPPLPAGTLCVMPANVLWSSSYLNGDPDQGTKRWLLIPEAVQGDQKLRFGGAYAEIRYDQWSLDDCTVFRQWQGATVFIELCALRAPITEERWTRSAGVDWCVGSHVSPEAHAP